MDGDPWPGAVEVYVERAGGTHDPVATITRPALCGLLAEPLPPGAPWRWNRGSELMVDVSGGILSGADEGAVLDGANALAVETGEGWEILQFAAAEPLGGGRYLLRDLLRGQSGSEPQAALGAPEGARAVLMGEWLPAVSLAPDAIGLARTYRFVPAGESLTGLAAVAETVTPAGTGYLPLSPVHVRARREAGDIHLAWTRRTRTGGDSWNLAEVPLGEEQEAYEIEVAAGGTVLRSAAAASPQWTYTATEQAADWGGGPAGAFTFRVMQMSAVVGRGAPKEVVIDV